MATAVVNTSTRIKKSTCQLCGHNVHIVPVGDNSVAVDPEITAFVAAGQHGGVLASAALTNGRRVHAEMCDKYKQDRERESRKRELREYNRKNRRRGDGL